MSKIKITLPDGSVKEFDKGVTSHQIALSISEGLARNVLSAKVNGEVWDSSRPIETDASVQLLTWNDNDGKATFWHSSAHLMAEALEALYPGVKLGIGPSIEKGFYYDVDFGDLEFDGSELEKVEKKMIELAREKNEYKRSDISKAEAIKYFTEKGDEYKLELLEGLEDGTITFYQQGNFTDLCRGPHIPHTGSIKAIKLLNVAGAYWRGDVDRKQLTRIYGITFPKQKELTEYLHLLEEAKKRDHRKLGKELELFAFSEKVGMGLPLWLPKGTMLRERLEGFLRKAQVKAGYDPVITPHIGSKQLYITSGHYEKYGEDSFQPITTPHEGEEFLLKPMNCPHHCEIYKTKPRSYKDLPIRYAEFGTVYRYEQHGELHGLTRVRGFTQDDAHIFCRPDQVKEEFEKVIDLVIYVFKALGFEDYTAQVSLRDPNDKAKYIGEGELWDKAEREIQEAADAKGLDTVTELGEAAFYGPKLDFMVKDALGRKWQLGTIQVDYQLPQRFELEYVGSDNQKHTPVMIHRAPFGSLERFIAVLTEHCAGNFPLWLTPDQVAVLPISEKYAEYANSVFEELKELDIRGFLDNRDEKIGRKIRDAEVKKIPFMIIVGEKEQADNKISVRRHGEGDLGTMELDSFVSLFKEEATI
ncbi:MAG: threonine--tRNA ligase [Cyclobacteriaceae bacterium]|nr:threonine--tRNA ligase [Cyclobacteriaceae bacterium]